MLRLAVGESPDPDIRTLPGLLGEKLCCSTKDSIQVDLA